MSSHNMLHGLGRQGLAPLQHAAAFGRYLLVGRRTHRCD